MEKTTPKFIHIIYNQDTDIIAFIHLGKPSIFARAKFKCMPCNKKKTNYAFIPRTVEEFLFFLKNTEITPSRNYNDRSFNCFRVQPSKEIEDQIPFNWILSRFGKTYFDTPDNYRIFTRQCNNIKQEKLNNLYKFTSERE